MAKSRREAEAASVHVNVTYDRLPGLYSIADCKATGKTNTPMVNSRGDTEAVFATEGLKIVEGSFSIGGQR